jgi:hypothetical protein
MPKVLIEIDIPDTILGTPLEEKLHQVLSAKPSNKQLRSDFSNIFSVTRPNGRLL